MHQIGTNVSIGVKVSNSVRILTELILFPGINVTREFFNFEENFEYVIEEKAKDEKDD